MFSLEERVWLLGLARSRIAAAAQRERAASVGVAEAPAACRLVRGGFVTLTIEGELRGCIGEILPRREIWRVVYEQAFNAAMHDPRFAPLTAAEVPLVRIEISVLTPPAAVPSWQNIELGRHGIILHKQGRSALFLPQVAPEQGWDLVTTLSHLALKAGLPRDAWREGAQFELFEAEVFGE